MKRSSLALPLALAACLAPHVRGQSPDTDRRPFRPIYESDIPASRQANSAAVSGDPPPSCPVCAAEGEGNCQAADGGFSWSIDRINAGEIITGGIMADDFIANSTTISQFCFSPDFICHNDCGNCICECRNPEGAELPPPDQFSVSFREDGGEDADPNTDPGFPGTLLANSPVGVVPISDKAFATCGSSGWDYSVVFDPPIQGLVEGRRYWVELSGIGKRIRDGIGCEVVIRSSVSGNGWALLEYDLFGTQKWDVNDLHPWKEEGVGQDWPFCINGGLTVPPPMTGACCACDGTCSDGMPWEDCLQSLDIVGGSVNAVGETIGLFFPLQACADIACENIVGSVQGDECSDPVVIEQQPFESTTLKYSNLCATTDGPSVLAACSGFPGENNFPRDREVGNDLWVATNASCDGRIDIDICGGQLDAVMAVYTNGTSTCPHEIGQCPPKEKERVFCTSAECSIGDAPTMGIRARSSCKGGSSDALPCKSDNECPGGTCEGQCFLIRLAGRNGEVGTGQIEIVCGLECFDTSPVVQETIFVKASETNAPSGKQRFLSFSVGDPDIEQAIRVTVASVSNVEQEYLVGSQWWVQQPEPISEAGSSRAPVPGFPSFQAARLGCARFDKNWLEVGVLHVYGEAVFPGASYTVDVIDETSANPLCFSEPVTIDTSVFGDVLTSCEQVPCSPAGDGSNINDVIGTIAGFQSSPEAPSKTRTEMEPSALDLRLNVTDVLVQIAAFQGLPYPFLTCDPATQVCRGGPNNGQTCETDIGCRLELCSQ